MFGNELKKYREEHGLSLRAMEQRVGISFTYISYIENGKMPSPDVIIRLAEEMGMPLEKALAMTYGQPDHGIYPTYVTEEERKQRLKDAGIEE